MDDLAGLYAHDGVRQRREKWTIVFHPVPRNVDDHNTKTQLFKVMLMLKTLVDGHHYITLALSLSNQLGVGKGSPLGFRDGKDFMIRESLPEARVNALV